MFNFGRKSAIRKRALELGSTLHHLVGCIQSQSFEVFVEAIGRKNFKESYIERGVGLSIGDRSYGFFEIGANSGDFSFHAKYPRNGDAMLITEGHDRYLGLVITGTQLDAGIFADLTTISQLTGEIGRDAKAIQAELIQLPGFKSMQALLASFRSQ